MIFNRDKKKRKKLGMEKVGIPVNEVMMSTIKLSSMEEYRGIKYDALQFYFQRFIQAEFMSMLDGAWSTQQLEAIDPNKVKVAVILLMRDFMQTYRADIVENAEDQKWDTQLIEQFTTGLHYESKTPLQPYQAWLAKVESEDTEDSALLVQGLGGQLEVDYKKLYLTHSVAKEVTFEDKLSG